jgi:hypothetical protein
LDRRRDDWLARALVGWLDFVLRRRGAVLVAILLATIASGVYAGRNLGFNLDPNDLFSPELRFQRMIVEFERHFPVLTNALLVVVDGDTPESTREVADELVGRLRARPDLFTSVYFPGEEAFFESHGLLYTELDDLDTFADEMARLQPVIGALSRDPSLVELSRVIRLGLEHMDDDTWDVERWQSVLDHFRRATVAVYAELPLSISWETVLLEGSPLDPTQRRVIVAYPVLEFERILAASRPLEAIREEALESGAGPESGVRVRITGYPALNHEEFLGLARDTGIAGALSFALIVVVLFVAFRSFTVVTMAAGTLLVGFVWTAGYAAYTVERLNPASIAFAVLFIGLGVDFLIHIGMILVDELRGGTAVRTALEDAVRAVGSALVLCAFTTAIGFLAFFPTDYRGVSELGVISAGGMVAILFLTLTLFPILVDWGLRDAAVARIRARRPWSVPFPGPHHPRLVVSVAAVLGVAGLLLVPHLRLETNVVVLRNPDTESVRTFVDLLDSDLETPWYMDALAPDLERAQLIALEVRALDTVERAITLADYVPSEQEEKLEILADVALMLDIPFADAPREAMSTEEQIEALRDLHAFLDAELIAKIPGGLARSALLLQRQLGRFLASVDEDPDPAAAIATLDEHLLAPLPSQFDRLRRNLETPEVTVDILPDSLVERMVARDGLARIQIFPAEDLDERDAMVRFVESVRPLWGDITGLPVNLVESSYATWNSLQEALLWAICAIALLLIALWRKPVDAIVALMPLLLAVVLSAAVSALIGLQLNFINVCVLPLLLGIGVDSGVHMVHRAKRLPPGGGVLLESTTAQAVFFSALTTVASFGTLILSQHAGIASLGELLLIGMLFTLAGNLVVLPALIVLQQRVGGDTRR